MADDKVALKLVSWGYEGKAPGERVEVDEATARMLVDGGVATPANKTAEKAVDITRS